MALSKSQKILTLKDPVSQLEQLGQTISETQRSKLSELTQQYLETKTKLEESQLLSKKASRQVGEAKRTGEPIDSLLADIKEYGRRSKTIQSQLDQLCEDILDYFRPQQDESTVEDKPIFPPARIHGKEKNDIESVEIIRLEGELSAWNEYVESNPAASMYHRSEWKALIEDVFGHECYFFYARCKDKIVGVLPLVRLNSKLFGDFMVSMPYFNYGGAIGDDLLIEQKLMQEANTFAEDLGTGHIEYRDDISRGALSSRTDKVNMLLSLPKDEETLWKRFPSKLRSQIKRAQREKTEINIGGSKCLADFYTVFARNMRDLGTPVYSKTLFKSILEKFPENSKIITIRYEGRSVAAAFLLGYKTSLEIPWASTARDVNHLSMNMLLYWEVLKFAIANGYSSFDFGRSSIGSGTFRFKQQWGAKQKQLFWHYWLSENADLPELNPNNPKYKLAINVWKRLPIIVTQYLGPSIVKYLP